MPKRYKPATPPETKTTASAASAAGGASAARLPRRIATALWNGSAVFFWRNGAWHMRTDRTGKARKLAASTSVALDLLGKAGHLFEGPPGFFRGCETAARPVPNDLESPLARLAALRAKDGSALVDQSLIAAGEKLRTTFERANLSPRLTANYERPEGQGSRHWQFSDNHIAKLTDGALVARESLHAALEAVGPELSGILFQVCCLAGGLENAERHLGLPRRSGKAVLQLALTRLARHYGLRPAMVHGGPQRIGHWAVADYRPGIPPAG